MDGTLVTMVTDKNPWDSTSSSVLSPSPVQFIPGGKGVPSPSPVNGFGIAWGTVVGQNGGGSGGNGVSSHPGWTSWGYKSASGGGGGAGALVVQTAKTLQAATIQTGGTKRRVVVSTLAEAEFLARGGFDFGERLV